MVVWGIGAALIYAFMAGVETEAGGDEGTTAQVVAVIVLGVWSLACAAYAIGKRHGEQER